jgi:hypothetical protein
MVVVPHFVNRQYFLHGKKKYIAPSLSTDHGCNEDIHPSKKHVRGSFTCYIQSKKPHIYSESKIPEIFDGVS